MTTPKLSTPVVELLLTAAAEDPLYQEMVNVTGAFRPNGLVFTRPCKIFQAKVFKEKKT